MTQLAQLGSLMEASVHWELSCQMPGSGEKLLTRVTPNFMFGTCFMELSGGGFHLIVSALAPHSLLSQAPLSLRLKCICLPQLLLKEMVGKWPRHHER